MITLKDIVHRVQWDDVQKRIVELYPDQEINLDGYREVFSQLLNLNSLENERDMFIAIEYVEPDPPINDEGYYSVNGMIALSGEKYALSFCKWEEWLGFYLDDYVIDNLGDIDIISHCLYEMTWNGFTQECIQEKIDYFHKLIDEIKEGKIEFFDFDEIKEKLDDDPVESDDI